MELLFSKLFVTIFGMAWQHPRKKKKILPPLLAQKLKKLDPSLAYAEPFIFHLSYSTLDEVPTKFNFFTMSQFDWPITK
jgi:hypothetical protein